jgi:hypothetical protein
MRYEVTVKEQGQEPERVICCRDCSTAAWQRNPDLLADGATNDKLRQQIEDKTVEITKPIRLPDPPSFGRDIGLDPPGYDR